MAALEGSAQSFPGVYGLRSSYTWRFMGFGSYTQVGIEPYFKALPGPYIGYLTCK